MNEEEYQKAMGEITSFFKQKIDILNFNYKEEISKTYVKMAIQDIKEGYLETAIKILEHLLIELERVK